MHICTACPCSAALAATGHLPYVEKRLQTPIKPLSRWSKPRLNHFSAGIQEQDLETNLQMTWFYWFCSDWPAAPGQTGLQQSRNHDFTWLHGVLSPLSIRNIGEITADDHFSEGGIILGAQEEELWSTSSAAALKREERVAVMGARTGS